MKAPRAFTRDAGRTLNAIAPPRPRWTGSTGRAPGTTRGGRPRSMARDGAGAATPVTVRARSRPAEALPTPSTACTCQVWAPRVIATRVLLADAARVATATPSTDTRYEATPVTASAAPAQLRVTEGPVTRARSAGAAGAGADGGVRSTTRARGTALRSLPIAVAGHDGPGVAAVGEGRRRRGRRRARRDGRGERPVHDEPVPGDAALGVARRRPAEQGRRLGRREALRRGHQREGVGGGRVGADAGRRDAERARQAEPAARGRGARQGGDRVARRR